jgi:hypothetical protein
VILFYLLKFQDLLRHTEETHPDYQDLTLALSKIEEVVAYVNERKRLAENLQKILDVQNLIESNEVCIFLKLPGVCERISSNSNTSISFFHC